MTRGYGLKISRPGFNVNNASPNELAFSSQFKTLKVHSYGSGSLTDGSRTATIAHNLGYVPLFMVHGTGSAGDGSTFYSSGEYGLLPLGTSGILASPAVGLGNDLFAYADSTNLYIKAQSNFGTQKYTLSGNSNEFSAEEDGGGYTTGFWEVGYDSISGSNTGAVRFSGIALPQGSTIYNATLNLRVGGRNGSGEIRMIVYGIDEDNTVVFNSGTPATARSKTTASTSSNSTLVQGNTLGVNVTSQVNEIIARGGWSSANAMGFIMNDNSTPSGNGSYFEDSGSGFESYLKIIKTEAIASYKYTIFKNQLE